MSRTKRGIKRRTPCPCPTAGALAPPLPPARVVPARGNAERMDVLPPPLPGFGSFSCCRLTARFMLQPRLFRPQLADLSMDTVYPAAGAELLQLDAVRIVAPVLLRGIRPLPALRAGHVYHHAVFLFRQFLSSTSAPLSERRR